MIDHGDRSVKKLAAAVMGAALKDYLRAVAANDRTVRRESKWFLTNDSYWHQALGLNPEYVKRWIHERSADVIQKGIPGERKSRSARAK